jgi:hypothetical protein
VRQYPVEITVQDGGTVMRSTNPAWKSFWGAAVAVLLLSGATARSGAAPEPAATPAGDVVNGTWQHHKVTFTYIGFTALFTCSGLEGHVRQILMHLGARKDAKVRARGCPGPFDAPSASAWVDADFYSLAPADNPAEPDAVKAHWTTLQVSPRQPDFMGGGDCELMQGMKDLITKNFTLRNVEYNTSCFPHDISLAGFELKGQALRAVPESPVQG